MQNLSLLGKLNRLAGIDYPDESELVAQNRTVEEIRKVIGADELTYTEVDDIKKVIGLPVCTACLDGSYPTEVEEYAIELRENRKRDRESAYRETEGKRKVGE